MECDKYGFKENSTNAKRYRNGIEKDYAEGKYKNVDDGLIPFPYYNAEYLNAPYDGEMTIAKAYAYLKTLPEFEGAEDV